MSSEPPAAKHIARHLPRLVLRDDALGRDGSVRTLVSLFGRRMASGVSRRWRDAARSMSLKAPSCTQSQWHNEYEDSEMRRLVHAVAADHTNLHLLANFRYYDVTVIDLRHANSCKLRERDFSSTRADATIIALAKGCPNVTAIYLGGRQGDQTLSKLTDKAVTFLASRCKKLTKIDCNACFNLTTTAAVALSNGCPDITTIYLGSLNGMVIAAALAK